MKPGTPEFNDTTPAPLERTGTPGTSFNLTPRGCMTPEGCERVAKAEQEFLNAKSALANWTANLCRELAGNSGSPQDGAKALSRSLDRERGRSGMDYGIDEEELAELLQHNRDAEEEFVRAVSGRPARTPSKA